VVARVRLLRIRSGVELFDLKSSEVGRRNRGHADDNRGGICRGLRHRCVMGRLASARQLVEKGLDRRLAVQA
jgi:hypothetical protein